MSAYFKHDALVFVGLTSISKHTMTVSGIKWAIKESLAIQISHTSISEVMSPSSLRDQMVKTISVGAEGKNKLAAVPVYFNLILHVVWIAFNSIVEFVNRNRGHCSRLHIKWMELQ